jgi:hypothetical protein
MGGARKLWILLLAFACAATLAACGGDDESTTGAPAAETTAQAPGGTGGQDGGGEAGSNGNGGGEGSQNGSGSQNGGSSGQGSAPVEGERSAAFRTPGGDNSIQEFGEEGDSSDRSEATAGIDALYRAIASGNWAEVCAKYLSAKNLEQIELLAEKAPQIKGKSCAEILGGLNQLAGAESPDKPDGGVAALRIEGDTAFAIWRGRDGKGYALPLTLENGEWKLTALAPTPLNPGT